MRRIRLGFILLLLAVGAGILIQRNPLEVPSNDSVDAVEYAVGAHRIFEQGSYNLPLADKTHPPRFAPWFSALVGYPAYLLFGSELGNPVIFVNLCGVLGVLLAYLIGARLAGLAGGVSAAALLIVQPGYVYFSRDILIDIPITLLVLTGAWIFISLNERSRSALLFLLAGIVTGLAYLFRPTGIVLAAPFVARSFTAKERGIKQVASLIGPIGLAIGLASAYNNSVFGSFLRTGYHYWLPIPYEFPSLVFSSQYVVSNLVSLITLTGLLPFLALVFIRLRTDAHYRALERYALWVGGLLAIIFLFYFYFSVRFFLPVTALLAVLGGARLGDILKSRPLWMKVILALLMLGALASPQFRSSVRVKNIPARAMVEAIKQTPSDAWIITGLNPVYVAELLGKSERRIVPVSRRIEYASKLIAPRPISMSNPGDALAHRSEALRTGGAEEAIPKVALEELVELREHVAMGGHVFLAVDTITSDEKAAIEKEFRLEPILPYLRALKPGK